MSSEMISGPDLGAGYLHQLTLDRDGERTMFTYHAQEGGQDAGGPPKGPLEAFGYSHPQTPCQFGGPRCWHRGFLLPFGETARVRTAYNRSRFVLEAMLDQQYAGRPVPFDETLADLVRRLRDPLRKEGIDWYLGGSAAVRLLGGKVHPRDLDLGTSRPGVDRIAQLLGEFLIEPLAPTESPVSGLVQGARAFVGTFREGMRVEWAVPLERGAPARWGEWTGVPGVARTIEVPYGEGTLQVTRPEYALVRSAERHRAASDRAISEVTQRLGLDRQLLDTLLARSTLSAPERVALLDSLER